MIQDVPGQTLSPEDQYIVERVGQEIMFEQKKEAREGLMDDAIVINSLEKIYEMEVTSLSPANVETFRAKTRPVYDKWARDIGVEIVRAAERIANNRKPN